MRNLLTLVALLLCATGCLAKVPESFVLVKGGAFKNTTSNFYGKGVTVSDFYIDKFDVTQKEWVQVMGSNPSQFKGDDLPVEMVNWYDSIEYCNKRSLQEGLRPFYIIDRHEKDPGNLDNVKWRVTVNPAANGYRLPTEAQWEYAAGGGQKSQNFTYAGGNSVDEVAWYWKNAGDTYLTGFWYWPTLQQNHNRTRPVGGKKPNELGLYDMSGNVREWCWDWSGDIVPNTKDPQGSSSGFSRVWKGGGWIGADFCCASAFRGSLAANGKGPDQGFRVCLPAGERSS